MFFPDSGLKGLRDMYSRVEARRTRLCHGIFGAGQKSLHRHSCIDRAQTCRPAAARDPFQPGGLLSLGKPGLIDDLFRKARCSAVATTKVAGAVPATRRL